MDFNKKNDLVLDNFVMDKYIVGYIFRLLVSRDWNTKMVIGMGEMKCNFLYIRLSCTYLSPGFHFFS